MLIDNELVNKILIDIECDICSVAKYFPLDYRDELKQEIRIRIWKFITNNTELFNDKDYEFIIDECRMHVYTYAILASKSILRDKNKYNKRHSNIDNHYIPCFDNYNNIDFSIDIQKYKSILSEREFKILEYLVSIGSNFKNFDSISRQLGYTGKNAAKYNLVNMATKILEFNSKNSKFE